MFDAQATAATASRRLAALVEFRFKEFDFEQTDFPWTWKKAAGEKVKIHSQCTFFASHAAVSFYEAPQRIHAF